MERSIDEQLGISYAAALSASHDPTPQLRQAMLLDLLGADRSLWPALRQLIEQPGFDSVRLDPSRAARLARRESLLQELATWCNQEILARSRAFLDGLLQLGPGADAQRQHSKAEDPSPGPSGAAAQQVTGEAEASAQAGEREAEVRRLSEQGIEASNRGEHQRAIALFSEALRRDGGDALLYMQRASVQALRGQTEAAILDFDSVLRLQPGNLEALAQRGQAKAALGRFEAAKQDWQRASQRGHRKAGNWLKRQLDRERAECSRDTTLQHHGSETDSQERTQPNQAPSTAGRRKVERPETPREESLKQKASTLKCEGVAARNRGDQLVAMAHFDAALRCDSSDAEVYKLRSELHARAGNFPMALKDLSASLRLDPNNAEALAIKGEIHYVMGEMLLARQNWQAAADRGNRDAKSWLASDLVKRATQAASEHQHSTVIRLCREALDLDRSNSQALLLKGTANLGVGSYNRAIHDLSQAITLDPANIEVLAEALLQRGNAYKALSRDLEAQADWQRAEGLGHPNTSRTTKTIDIVKTSLLGLLAMILGGYLGFRASKLIYYSGVAGWLAIALIFALTALGFAFVMRNAGR